MSGGRNVAAPLVGALASHRDAKGGHEARRYDTAFLLPTRFSVPLQSLRIFA